MEILPEWAPNIHPMLVHFPLAIFFFAAFMDLLTFFLDKKWWDEKKTAVTYFIGAVAAVIVYFTGKMAADSIEIPKVAYDAVGGHAGWAEWTIWFFGIYAVVRLVMSAIGKVENNKVHVTFFLLSLIGLFFLYETGEHGAKLVFNYGLGTSHPTEQKTGTVASEDESNGFSRDSTGWSWSAGPNAPKVFSEHFRSLTKDTAASKPALISRDSTGFLQFSGNRNFFATTNNDYHNFQLDVELSGKSLDGDLYLIHHVRDAQNYDFMVLHPDGSASLGRMHNGSKETIEEGNGSWGKLQHIRFVNSGEHQRGYVNGDLILHGHTEAAPAGGVGLKTEGMSKLQIRKMQLSKLDKSQEQDQSGDEHEH